MLQNSLPRYLLLIVLATMAITLSGCAGISGKPNPDYIEPTTGMGFKYIRGGLFQMGDAADGQIRELPIHTVTFEGFAASIFEVTFEQYDKFCDATSRDKPDDEDWGRGNRPVINVNWEDAKAYAEWLRQQSGLNVSLPSESQWEYIARAGTTSRFWTGDTLPKNSANCEECGSRFDNRMTAPVGSFRPNRWGLFDTAGNVAEWTLDDWQPGYEGAPDDGSARINGNTEDKVYRGGAWNYPLTGLESATRDWSKKSDSFDTVGFRLVINNFVAAPKK